MNDLKMDEWLKHLPFLTKIHQEIVALDRPFKEIAQAFANDTGTVLLLSGTTLDCSHYHILGATPWLELESKQDTVRLRVRGKEYWIQADPFTVIQTLVDRFRLKAPCPDFPVQAGLFGYFSYDLKDRIETLPITCMDTHLPDLCLYAPSIILVQDKISGQTRLFIPVPEDHEALPEKAGDIIRNIKNHFYEKLNQRCDRNPFSIDSDGFKSSFTKPEYIRSVKKIIDYLKAGDIYQANLSQRFEAGFSGDAYSLFLDLYDRNPAPFFSYIQAKDHTIVSTSPERFIKQTGRHVETRPIKGTIARGTTEEKDKENGRLLKRSAKDDAELTMIVDLMRNDLSRVTRHGSVIVKEHKRLEPYDNVFHLVSIVEGELKEDKTGVDLITATFPGGSITGCPKIRSMEIIDELESVKRHVYTGSIGYISFHDTMDLSIAIRTATIADQQVFFSVGGGIVYDSDPEKEFQETLDKGKTLMESLSGTEGNPKKHQTKAWLNGKFVDQHLAGVPVQSIGFQYGAGLFETMRVEKGVIFRLPDHLARLTASWKSLFSERLPDMTWEDVIHCLIRENQFQDKVVAVKLVASIDACNSGKNPFLAVFARPYTHRLNFLNKAGLDLVTYPFPRQSPLADHKTLNYLYYYQAGQFAKSRNKDEAIILNPDETVSETNTASMFAVSGNTIMVPESDHVLGSVTLRSVLTILKEKGYEIRRTPMQKDEFYSYPDIILANALMGAVRVLSIDDRQVKQEKKICSMINERLFDMKLHQSLRKGKK